MKISDKGFIVCPECGKLTKTKVRADTVLIKFPLFCTWCKKEYLIDKPEPRARANT